MSKKEIVNNEEENVMFCPFRVFTEVHPAMLRGNGDITSMQFYPCVGGQCMAFNNGKCMRLVGDNNE